MRAYWMSVVCLAWLLQHAAAGDAISPKTLAAIKRATVFVKVEARGQTVSGSGFVVKVDGDTALVVTNHHVVEPKVKAEPPRPFGPFGPNPFPGPGPIVPGPFGPQPFLPGPGPVAAKNVVTVVFDSGTKNERTFKAELLAADAASDLAVLRIKGAKELPEPIDHAKSPEVVETTPVYTFGFPFGKALSTGKGNPAITVGKHAISSLRENDDGELALIQIDGSLNPGNSGGPVVDARGQLVGVAVATIKNSTGIGLAIPAAEVRKTLMGRLGNHQLATFPGKDGKLNARFDVSLIDPLNKISSVTLHYVLGSAVKDPTKLPDSLATLGDTVDLVIDKQVATGRFVVDAKDREKGVLLQIVYANEPGKKLRSKVVRASLGPPPVAKPVFDPNGGDGHTRIVGDQGKFPITNQAPEGGLLIGLEVGRTNHVVALRPIYRTAKGDELKGVQFGANLKQVVTVKAKDGYAVGALTVYAGGSIDGLCVTFMKVVDKKLDPSDSYRSDFLGGEGGGRIVLAGDGSPVIGIIGNSLTDDLRSIGLLVKPLSPKNPSAKVDPPKKEIVKSKPLPLVLPPAPAGTAGKTMIDLIERVDPVKDKVQGNWEVTDKILHCKSGGFFPRIEFPYLPPEEYDLIVVFGQPRVRAGVSFIMPNPKGGSFFWFLGNENGDRFGFWPRTRLEPGTLANDTVYTTKVEVRRTGVKGFLDGKEILDHPTDFRDLTENDWRRIRDKRLLALACDDTTIFYHVRVVEISGAGKQTR